MFHALVVDDHAAFRASVVSVLRREFSQISVEEAGDGPDALRTIDVLGTDLVLLDIRLPSENGLELTKAIKTAHASVTVVILTGYDLPQYRQEAFRNGADCFIYKGAASCMGDVIARVEGAIRTHEEAARH
jgi:DNA-binding NarL/FixJ family response regulator